MKDSIPLLTHLALEEAEEFNAIYKPKCEALADWFIRNPDNYLLTNSGHAFRLDTLNTEGIWFFRQINGKWFSVADHWIRWCFAGRVPDCYENPGGTLMKVQPNDLKGPMNFLTPTFRKWAEITNHEFEWLPSSARLPLPYQI